MTQWEDIYLNQHSIKVKIIVNIFAIIFGSCLWANEILLNKKGVTITEYDLNSYEKIYKDYYEALLNKKSLIKNLYMMIKIVDHQSKINPSFKTQTANIVDEQIKNFPNYNSEILSYFIRYELIKNDFSQRYINQYDLEKINGLIPSLFTYYESAECADKIGTLKFDELNRDYKLTLLSSNKKTLTIEKENQIMHLCLTNLNLKEIREVLITIINKERQKKFLTYVFQTIKKN